MGCDNLNATRYRFGRGVSSPKCPCCPEHDETVFHFLCECKLYTKPRQNLWNSYCDVYPDYKHLFNDVSLLGEPIGKYDTDRHAPVIDALNAFLTEAHGIRSEYLRINSELSFVLNQQT